MLFFSSIWDGILKVATVIVCVVGAIALQKLAWSQGWSSRDLALETIGGAVLAFFLAYRFGVSIVASWLHGRLTLRAPISLSDARSLRVFFQLDWRMHWLPFSEVKELPVGQRREALLHALATLGTGRHWML